MFCPIPSFPRGEGIKDFSPTGRKKEGLIFIIQAQRDYTFIERKSSTSFIFRFRFLPVPSIIPRGCHDNGKNNVFLPHPVLPPRGRHRRLLPDGEKKRGAHYSHHAGLRHQCNGARKCRISARITRIGYIINVCDCIGRKENVRGIFYGLIQKQE